MSRECVSSAIYDSIKEVFGFVFRIRINSRKIRFFNTIPIKSSATERKTRFATLKFAIKTLTLLAPAMLPRLAPAEIMPKSLVLASLLKTSASKLQAEEKAKRLKTLLHT